MYRQYEDQYELEKQLKELRRKYSNTKENNADENTLIELSQDIHELEERVNFAWQDDEYECDGE